MVTANNMFRPQTGHHQVIHPMKRVGSCTIYKVTALTSDRSYIVYCTAQKPFPLCVQPDDGLLEAETCSC